MSSDLLADILPGTGAVSVSVSPLAGARRAGRCCRRSTATPTAARSRSSAARCRCSTSTSSRRPSSSALDDKADERVRDAIERVLARQDSNGSFGLWGVGGEDIWLDAYVDRLPDPRARARLRRAASAPSASPSTACATSSPTPREVDEKRRGARLCGLCAGPQRPARDGRPALPRRHQAGRLRDAARPRPDRRGARRCSATAAASQTAFASAVEQLREIARRPAPTRPDYGSRLRDGAGMLALAAEAGAVARARSRRSRRWSRRSAREPAHTSTQENAWMVLAAAGAGAGRGGDLAHRRRRAAQGRALPHLQGRGAGRRAGDHRQRRRGTGAGGGQRHRQPDRRRSRPPRRATRSSAATTSSTARRSSRRRSRQNDRLVDGAQGHGAARRASPACSWSTACRPASRSTTRTSSTAARSAALDWLKTEVEPAHAEYRDDRFVAAFDRDAEPAGLLHRRLHRPRRGAGPLRPPAGARRGHVPARPLRPHRLRLGRGRRRRGRDAAAMRRTLPRARGAASRRSPIAPVAGLALAAGAGAPSRGGLAAAAPRRAASRALARPLAPRRTTGAPPSSSTATAGCCAPSPPPTAAGGCRSPPRDVDPRFLAMLQGLRGRALRPPSRRRPAGRCCAPAARSLRNGRVVSGGSTLTMQVARLLEPRDERTLAAKLRQIVRAVQLERRLSQGRDPRPLSRARALRRQPRGRARREPRLFRQGAEAPLVRRGGAARRPAAIARDAPPRPLPARPRAGPATACSTARARAASSRRRRPRGAKAEPRADGAQALPDARRRTRPRRRSPSAGPRRRTALTIDARLQAALEALARERAERLGPQLSAAHPRHRQRDRRGPRPGRQRRTTSRRSAPAPST